MKNNHFNDPHPTALEEQAHAEARQHFAEHLNQFPACQDAVQQFEKGISRTALSINMTTARTSPLRTRIQTDDGATWYKSLDLMDNVSACYRPTSAGIEFAVVERLPSADAHEVVARGRNVSDVLKAFAQDQRKALQLWTEDLSAHVSEFLAEKYPGQDMSRVADALTRRVTESVSQEQGRNQNRSRGIGI